MSYDASAGPGCSRKRWNACGVKWEEINLPGELQLSIHHQKWIPLQRYRNIRRSSAAAAVSIAAYLLMHPSGRSLKGRRAGLGLQKERFITHHAISPLLSHPSTHPHPQFRPLYRFDRACGNHTNSSPCLSWTALRSLMLPSC